jgi:hypothetical protein
VTCATQLQVKNPNIFVRGRRTRSSTGRQKNIIRYWNLTSNDVFGSKRLRVLLAYLCWAMILWHFVFALPAGSSECRRLYHRPQSTVGCTGSWNCKYYSTGRVYYYRVRVQRTRSFSRNNYRFVLVPQNVIGIRITSTCKTVVRTGSSYSDFRNSRVVVQVQCTGSIIRITVLSLSTCGTSAGTLKYVVQVIVTILCISVRQTQFVDV